MWSYLWPFAFERHVLQTKLNPEQCQVRIRKRLAPWNPLVRTSEPISGVVSQSGFSISKNDGKQNSFRPVATGRFIPTAHGSRITVRLSMSPFIIALMAVWLALPIFISVPGLGALARELSSGHPLNANPAMNVIGGSLLLMLVGYGICVLGRWLGRGEGPFLLQFLQKTLEATELPHEKRRELS